CRGSTDIVVRLELLESEAARRFAETDRLAERRPDPGLRRSAVDRSVGPVREPRGPGGVSWWRPALTFVIPSSLSLYGAGSSDPSSTPRTAAGRGRRTMAPSGLPRCLSRRARSLRVRRSVASALPALCGRHHAIL